jgi:hypothetical protein
MTAQSCLIERDDGAPLFNSDRLGRAQVRNQAIAGQTAPGTYGPVPTSECEDRNLETSIGD